MGDEEERWLQAACRRIEEELIEGKPDGFPSTLQVRRRGKLIAIVLCPDPRVLVLRLSRAAVAGFCADELVFLADAYGTQQETNPEGQPWSVGEMQRRAQEPAIAAILYEAVQLYRVPRGGPVKYRIVAYERRAGRVVWDEPREGHPFGLFVKALHAAIETRHLEPGTPVVGVRPGSGLNPAQVRLECDIGTVRALYEMAGRADCSLGVGLAVPKDSWSQRRARRSFERVGIKCNFL